MNPFPCTKCGACCVLAGKVGLMPQRDDGACVHLGADNECTIYETRPDLCRISFLEPLFPDREQYHALTAEACNAVQVSQGIDESFRVTT